MQGDLIYILFWWLTFFVLGSISIPTAWYLFRNFVDRGYGFTKALGLLAVGYIYFLLGITHLAPFTNPTLIVILLVLAFANFKVFKKNQKKIVADYKASLRVIVMQEIIFTLGLLFWSYVRAHQPDINGLEKFMDFGFVNSILRGKYLPPDDMWFAGQSINYYWFGHYLVAVATKLSGISSAITYNLFLATILGLSLSGVFSIVSTLTANISKKISLTTICLVALFSAVLVNFAGNFHTPYYVAKEGSDTYWYPNATRFIGYNPETNDKTIHEFPLYSYVVSDLHAHLINLPYVILFIGLLFSFIYVFDKKKTPTSKVLALGFLLGVFFMTNAWDFANYSLLTTVTFSTYILLKNKLNQKTILSVLKVGISILAAAIVTVFPFMMHFESLAQGIELVHSHSLLWQLAILWGFPAILTISFLAFLGKHINKLRLSDVFVLALLVTSWILIALPEVIYVKDIYIASHYRANTMFKLTYQAFVISYLSSAYVIYRITASIKDSIIKLPIFLFYLLTVGALLTYPSYAIDSYYNDLKVYKGLNGITWAKISLNDRYQAIEWFNQNVTDQPTILEAPGDSYTEFNIISSYTGLPTVSGWFVHEWLWRGDSSFPQERVGEISTIYTSTDEALTKALLGKYKVEYVIIGDQEREKFPTLNENKFYKLGSPVFTSGNLTIFKLQNNL